MKIKNKLYVNAGIAIFLVVTLFSVVLVVSGRVIEEKRRHELMDNVRVSISELDLITYDYLLHREKRMSYQWNLKYKSLGKILNESAEEERLKSIDADYVTIGNLFSLITANYQKRQQFIQEGSSQEMIDIAVRQEERFVAQLLITSHSVITDASRIAKETHAEAMKTQALARNMTLILMIILAITVTSTSLLVAGSITKPLNKLTQGAEIIGKGNLEHRVEIKTKDEISELAVAFNQMTQNLKVSLYELKKEIAVRKLAEEEVRESEKRIRNLMENLPIGIAITTPEGDVPEVNTALWKIFGYDSKEEFLNIPIEAHYYNSRERERFVRLHKKGLVKGWEVQLKHKDGSVFWGAITSATFLTEAAKTEFINVFEDITERKKMEEKNNRLSLLLRSVRDVNQLITKEKNRDVLLQESCKIFTRDKGYVNVWIILFDEEYKVDFAAKSGVGDNFELLLNDLKKGKVSSCVKKVLNQPEVLLMENPESEYADSPVSGKYEGRAAIAVRLEYNKKVYGLLCAKIEKEYLADEQMVGLFTEVTEDISFALYRLELEAAHKLTEEQIKKDLEEKKALIQELYHRTKNNMQVVSSMLKMQSRHSESELVHNAFREIINKIKSMSLVHEKLYQADDLSKINLKDYIENLIRLLRRSYSQQAANVSLNFELEDVFVLIDSAIPLALVLNELISNVFKHAFPESGKGELSIRLYQEENGTINIHLADNGVGLPVDFDLAKVKTMGLPTMFSLIDYQLKGEVTYLVENGLKWHMKFWDDLQKTRV